MLYLLMRQNIQPALSFVCAQKGALFFLLRKGVLWKFVTPNTWIGKEKGKDWLVLKSFDMCPVVILQLWFCVVLFTYCAYFFFVYSKQLARQHVPEELAAVQMESMWCNEFKEEVNCLWEGNLGIQICLHFSPRKTQQCSLRMFSHVDEMSHCRHWLVGDIYLPAQLLLSACLHSTRGKEVV